MRAAELYLPEHEKLPALAYDLAYFWLTRGHPGRALPVFQQLVPLFDQPPQRLQVLAAIARAAGAMQDRVAFESAWNEAFALLAAAPGVSVLPAAFLDLGFGAAHFGEWERAEQAIILALDASRKSGSGDIQLRAEDSLVIVRGRGNPDTIMRPAGLTQRQLPAEHLARRFVSALGKLSRTSA